MKILLAIATLGLLLAQSSLALTQNDLAGKWVGTRVTKKGGQTTEEATTFIFKKSGGGLTEHRTTQLAGGTLKSSGKYPLYSNSGGMVFTNEGPADFFSSKGGKVVSVASGDWSFEGKTFRLYLSSESDGSYSTTTIRLLNRRTFILAIRFSTGASATGRFVRQ